MPGKTMVVLSKDEIVAVSSKYGCSSNVMFGVVCILNEPVFWSYVVLCCMMKLNLWCCRLELKFDHFSLNAVIWGFFFSCL